MFNRFIIVAACLFCTAAISTAYPQSYPDRLELYDPFSEFDQIRAVLMNSFSEIGKTSTALIQEYKAQLPETITAENRHRTAVLLTRLGDIYTKSDRIDIALEKYFRALKLFEEEHDSNSAAVECVKIGKAYLLGSIVLQTDYISKGYEILRNSPVPEMRAYGLYGHAAEEPDPVKREALYREALSLQLKAVKENPARSDLLENLSKYYNALGKYDEAIAIARKTENSYLLAMYLNNYGYQKMHEGKYEEALTIFFKSRRVCYQDLLKGQLRNTFNDMGETYWRMGNLRKACAYYGMLSLSKKVFTAKTFIIMMLS